MAPGNLHRWPTNTRGRDLELETESELANRGQDVNTYRRCAVFERVMSLAASPALPKSCFEKVCHLLYRCALVGGSTTLITRCSVLSWIRARMAMKGPFDLLLSCSDSKIRATCDAKHILEWSNGALSCTSDRESISYSVRAGESETS